MLHTLQVSNLLPKQSCHLARVATLQICQSPTLQLGLKSSQEHWSNHSNSLAKGCPAQCSNWSCLQNRSGHCKMLQKQPNHAPTLHSNTLNLPTCPRCTDTAMSNLLPSKAVTWQSCNIANLPKSNPSLQVESKATKSTGQTTPSHWLPSYTSLHGFQLQVLVAEQIWPLQDVASCSYTKHPSAQGSNCRSVKLPHLLAKDQSAGLTFAKRSGHCKMLQIYSSYQPDYAPTLHCQGNLSLLQICPHSKLRLKAKQPRTLKPPQLTGQRPICTGSNCRS